MSAAPDLVTQLRAAGDRLHVLAADALEPSGAELERLSERVEQLEAIAGLNGETITNMQRAASSQNARVAGTHCTNQYAFARTETPTRGFTIPECVSPS